MKIYFIGKHNDIDGNIDAFAEEDKHKICYSGEISNIEKLNRAVEEAKKYSVAIIDVLEIKCSDMSAIRQAVKTLVQNNTTRLICYAPCGSISDGVKVCKEAGVKYFVCDFLGIEIMKKLRNYISDYEKKLLVTQTAETQQAVQNQVSKKPLQLETQQNTAVKSTSQDTQANEAIEQPQSQNESKTRRNHMPEIQQIEPELSAQNSNHQPIVYTQSGTPKETGTPNQMGGSFENTANSNNIYSVSEQQNNERATENVSYQNIGCNSTNEQNQKSNYDVMPNYDVSENQTGYARRNRHNSINDNDTVHITKKIGVIGVIPRIGTTTQSVHIVRLLQELGFKSCYIQQNKSSFLDNMQDYFNGVEINNETECLYYDDLEFYKSKNQVYGLKYDYQIFDYGCVETVPSDFFEKDIRIVVCGGTAEEVEKLTAIANQLYEDNDIKYIFSFVADYEKADVYDLMSSKAHKTYFAPYAPDCFKLTDESREILARVINVQLPQSNKKKGRGKKQKVQNKRR